MTIAESVEGQEYRRALELQALTLAKQIDHLKDEKNLAPISRELRLILVALGIDVKDLPEDRTVQIRESVEAKLNKPA